MCIRKVILAIVFFVLLLGLEAQTIEMNFPAFEGKTYEFVIFQGGKNVKVQRDIIPAGGKFKLVIPDEYAPYVGMSRWLLTNNRAGGGLDMEIPGKGFSVSCTSEKPTNENITYEGFDAVNELNRIHREQQQILNKFELANRATELYDNKSELYVVFSKEKENQAQAYEKFHEELKKSSNYNARFLPIVNLTQGIPNKLTGNHDLNAKLNAAYYANELNFDDLYSSGHWTGILAGWVQLHTNVLKNDSLMLADFTKMGERIKDPKIYTDFVTQITYYLNYYGKDKYIDLLAPTVLSSGKITNYGGKLALYQKTLIGHQAPDLVLKEYLVGIEDNRRKTIRLKSKDFAKKGFEKTLLIFYESGCGHCEQLLNQLPGNYKALKEKGVEIIAVSADEYDNVFKEKAKDFPWQRTYCDYEGREGVNFINYAVPGTPTIYLIDKDGKIEKRLATMQEILEAIH